MVIKNIMDIHANWKWGSILPKRRLKEEEGMPLHKEIADDDVLMKFPLKDPRTSKSWKGKKKVKSVESKDIEIKSIEVQEDTTQEVSDKEEKNSES